MILISTGPKQAQAKQRGNLHKSLDPAAQMHTGALEEPPETEEEIKKSIPSRKPQTPSKIMMQAYTNSGRPSTSKFLTQQMNAALAATANSSMSEIKGKP